MPGPGEGVKQPGRVCAAWGLGQATHAPEVGDAKIERRSPTFAAPNFIRSGARRASSQMNESTLSSTPSGLAARRSARTFQPPHSRARFILRWLGRVAVVVLGLLAAGAAGIYGLSERKLRARFAVPEHRLVVSEDAATVARGEHVATVRGCVDCHGPGFVGNTILDQPMIGRVAGPNLTLGGRGADLEARDWDRAVRHSVRPDCKPLVFMPSHEFTVLTDEDLGAIVAYARSVPPVRRAAPSTYAGPMLRLMYVAGKLELLAANEIDHARAHEPRLTAEPTVAYGKYLASGCTGCHGEGLSGGKIPGAPPEWGPAANITPAGIGKWSATDFATALRTGRRPDGSAIDSTLMPIRLLRHMDDVELTALYAYLRTVPAREYGNR